MSYFQRVKSFLRGTVTLLFALILFLFPEDGCVVISLIIAASLFLYGCRQMIYYFSMARHMVGGKWSLCQAVIALDLSLFTLSVSSMGDYIIPVYLLGIYAFSGAIDILRALETKRVGAASWKRKLTGGVVSVLFAVALVIVGVIAGDRDILVYGYTVSLIYSSVLRIIAAFRKTAIVYIP